MEGKVGRICSPTKSTILISTVTLLLCLCQFFRTELILNEQMARVDKLEMIKTQRDKNTAVIENIKSMLNAQVTRMKDFEDHINKYPCSHLKRKKRAIIPDQQQMAAELAELKRYLPKIIQALGALQLEKKIPGPRGPPGQSVVPPRSVIISPPRLVISESQSAILECSASGYPQPVVAWSKVNGSLPKQRFFVDSSGKLELKNVTIHDSGTYQCKASNILGSAEDKSEIEVNFSPRVSLTKGPIYKMAGDDIRIPTCHVTGIPEPKVTWSMSIGSLPDNRSVVRDGQLTVLKAEKDDSGIYVCKAENSLGSAVGSIMVNVIDLPVFVVKPPSSKTTHNGATIVLNCSAKGDPQPVVSWKKDNGVLPVGRYEVKNASLIIRNVKKTDSGVFSCTATSAGVSHSHVSTTLTILHFKDCAEIYKSGERRNGVYTVQPDKQPAFQVYCDMITDGGGWSVFQRRQDGSVDFFRNWTQYKTGFGNLYDEFWLGNDYIHRLTSRTPTRVRVEVEDWYGTRKYAKYGSFSVGDESDKYRLTVGSYSGSAGDSLAWHNNMAFTTKDKDNDKNGRVNCASLYIGAWWYNDCYYSNLNGKYLGNKVSNKGMIWFHFHDNYPSLKKSEMKMRTSGF